MINLCNCTRAWSPILTYLLVEGGVKQALTATGQHPLMPICLRWQTPDKTTPSQQTQLWWGGSVTSHWQHLPFVESWHQQVLLFTCTSLFWSWPDQVCPLQTCAVCPSIIKGKEGHFCLKWFRGKKRRCSVPQQKLIVKSSPLYQSMEFSPDYISYWKYVHMASKLVTINTNTKHICPQRDNTEIDSEEVSWNNKAIIK